MSREQADERNAKVDEIFASAGYEPAGSKNAGVRNTTADAIFASAGYPPLDDGKAPDPSAGQAIAETVFPAAGHPPRASNDDSPTHPAPSQLQERKAAPQPGGPYYVKLTIGDDAAATALANFERSHGRIAAELFGDPFWATDKGSDGGQVRLFTLPPSCRSDASKLRVLEGPLCGCASLRLTVESGKPAFDFAGPGAHLARPQAGIPQLPDKAYQLLKKGAGR
jgi:hypothetical protein